MTRKEEAIKIFQDKIKTMEDGAICCDYGNDKDAFIFAIQAIQAFQSPCEDAISKQKVNILVDELARAISDERCCMPRGRSTGAIMQDILDLPPVTPQEPFDDTILTLTKTLTKRVVTQVTEDIDNFIFTTIKPWCEAKEQREISKRDLEQALTQYFGKEPCEDAISRQAVLDQTYLWSKDEFLRVTNPFDYLRKRIKYLSPVTPQQKIGHWIKYGVPRCGEQHYKCTSCGYYINFGQWGELYTKEFKYCPNCKANMVEPQENNYE